MWFIRAGAGGLRKGNFVPLLSRGGCSAGGVCRRGVSTGGTSTSGSEDEGPEELKARVLDAAVRHVVAAPGGPAGATVSLGFTRAALQAGCRDVGVGPSAVGLFARPEAQLVEHLSARLDRATLDEVRRLLAAAAAKESKRGERAGEGGEGGPASAGASASSPEGGSQVSEVWRGRAVPGGGLLPHKLEGRMGEMLRHRLGLLVPYLPVWGGALSAKVSDPRSLGVAARDAAKFVDDLLYAVGDRTGEMGWYSKRALWLSVYKASEARLLADLSVDFADTWDFLERRIKDARAVETNLGALALVSRVAAKEGEKIWTRLGDLRYPREAPSADGPADGGPGPTRPI